MKPLLSTVQVAYKDQYREYGLNVKLFSFESCLEK